MRQFSPSLLARLSLCLSVALVVVAVLTYLLARPIQCRWKQAEVYSVLAAHRQDCPAGGATDEGRQPGRRAARPRRAKTA